MVTVTDGRETDMAGIQGVLPHCVLPHQALQIDHNLYACQPSRACESAADCTIYTTSAERRDACMPGQPFRSITICMHASTQAARACLPT